MTRRADDDSWREYPDRPIIAVGVLVQDGRRVLLIQRGTDPGKGTWSLPGGMVELGEVIKKAAMREVEEETGLKIEVNRLLGVFDRILFDGDGRVKVHYLIVDFLGHPVGGELRITREAMDYRWVDWGSDEPLPVSEDIMRMIRELREVS